MFPYSTNNETRPALASIWVKQPLSNTGLLISMFGVCFLRVPHYILLRTQFACSDGTTHGASVLSVRSDLTNHCHGPYMLLPKLSSLIVLGKYCLLNDTMWNEFCALVIFPSLIFTGWEDECRLSGKNVFEICNHPDLYILNHNIRNHKTREAGCVAFVGLFTYTSVCIIRQKTVFSSEVNNASYKPEILEVNLFSCQRPHFPMI